MVKTNTSFELSRRFALHDGQNFSRRFSLQPHKFKSAASSCNPKSPLTTLMKNTLSELQNEWKSEFNPQNDNTTSNGLEKISTMVTSGDDFTENVMVPQGDWDDLFDKAVVALNTAFVEEDLPIFDLTEMQEEEDT
jgi:hypothetical protein